ncbi:hypothetical protein CDAR_459141 [Caerostris darwini]|uniref:Uncharacterized protein n=1 Tax=Caerostris darwini TaxID=1538125 RepID=A0AAV4M7M5_9ARAC|nr:hypothetical protein CDAR_459141 [Caerostris darwini]
MPENIKFHNNHEPFAAAYELHNFEVQQAEVLQRQSFKSCFRERLRGSASSFGGACAVGSGTRQDLTGSKRNGLSPSSLRFSSLSSCSTSPRCKKKFK